MGRVTGLWRYPVKSAGGEPLEELRLTPEGIIGDRRWAVVEQDGTLVSAKHPQRGGRLLLVSCRYDDASSKTVLSIPDQDELIAGTADADLALSRWLGRAVRLTDTPSAGQRLRRWWPSVGDLVPEWESRAVPGEEAVTRVAGVELRRSFADYGALHLLTAPELRRLSAVLGTDVDPVRFRPNILIDEDVAVADRCLAIGEAMVDIEIPTPRCAVPGLSPVDGSLDKQLLRSLATFDRKQVGRLGTAACFGVYGLPMASAIVRVGDSVVRPADG